jgi:hypothetical protein
MLTIQVILHDIFNIAFIIKFTLLMLLNYTSFTDIPIQIYNYYS